MSDILVYPDRRLRQVCTPVEFDEDDIESLIKTLVKERVANNGIGISAPQIGSLKRAFLIGDEFYANPEIERGIETVIVSEGCLSFPGIFVKTSRSKAVLIRAQDRTGKPFVRQLFDIEAVCAQHENEHLDGRLLIDRMTRRERRQYGLTLDV